MSRGTRSGRKILRGGVQIGKGVGGDFHTEALFAYTIAGIFSGFKLVLLDKCPLKPRYARENALSKGKWATPFSETDSRNQNLLAISDLVTLFQEISTYWGLPGTKTSNPTHGMPGSRAATFARARRFLFPHEVRKANRRAAGGRTTASYPP
jgi:hypothetical protein